MKKHMIFTVVALMLLTLAAVSVSAQDATSTPGGTTETPVAPTAEATNDVSGGASTSADTAGVAGSGVSGGGIMANFSGANGEMNSSSVSLFEADFNTFAAGLPDLPAGAVLTDIVYLDQPFANYQLSGVVSCGSSQVYKVSPEGVLDLWPSSCQDGNVNLQTAGRGHFVFVNFGTTEGAFAAPERLTNINFGTADGSGFTVDLANSTVCYNNVAGMNMPTGVNIYNGTDTSGSVFIPLMSTTTEGATVNCAVVGRDTLIQLLRNPGSYSLGMMSGDGASSTTGQNFSRSGGFTFGSLDDDDSETDGGIGDSNNTTTGSGTGGG